MKAGANTKVNAACTELEEVLGKTFEMAGYPAVLVTGPSGIVPEAAEEVPGCATEN